MPFAKGVSGNPGGSRKRRVVTQQLIAALNEIDPQDGISRLRKVVDQLISKAISGDVSAIKEIVDRVDGRVPQAIVGDDDHAPMRIDRIERVIVYPRHQDGGGLATAPSNHVEPDWEPVPRPGGERP